MRCTQQQPRAFVLLWTLALLALAAVVLTGLTRRSAHKAVEAIQAQDELQFRWTMATTRKLMLARAESLLQQAERQRHQPIAAIWLDGALGDAQLEIRVADEQAKLNVNALYDAIGPEQTASQLRQMIKDPTAQVLVELHPDPRLSVQHHEASPPATAPTTAPSLQPRFRCWSQVVAPDDPAILFQRTGHSVTDEFTCWGNGKLNLQRASDAALSAALKPQLSPAGVQTVLRARQQKQSESTDHPIAAASLSQQDRQALSAATTSTSSCFSVVIHARMGQRNCYELAIREIDNSSQNDGQSTTQPSGADNPPQNEEKPDRIRRLVW